MRLSVDLSHVFHARAALHSCHWATVPARFRHRVFCAANRPRVRSSTVFLLRVALLWYAFKFEPNSTRCSTTLRSTCTGRLKMMSMLAGSSVEALCKRAPGKGAPVEAITSGASLGAHMETYGFSAVPSLANKDPAKALQAAGVSTLCYTRLARRSCWF